MRGCCPKQSLVISLRLSCGNDSEHTFERATPPNSPEGAFHNPPVAHTPHRPAPPHQSFSLPSQSPPSGTSISSPQRQTKPSLTNVSPPPPHSPSPSPNRSSHPAPHPPAHRSPHSRPGSDTARARPPRSAPRRPAAGSRARSSARARGSSAGRRRAARPSGCARQR